MIFNPQNHLWEYELDRPNLNFVVFSWFLLFFFIIYESNKWNEWVNINAKKGNFKYHITFFPIIHHWKLTWFSYHIIFFLMITEDNDQNYYQNNSIKVQMKSWLRVSSRISPIMSFYLDNLFLSCWILSSSS